MTKQVDGTAVESMEWEDGCSKISEIRDGSAWSKSMGGRKGTPVRC